MTVAAAASSCSAEGPAHPNLWNPTILGVLVVLSAIGLFCGSAYLLLGTNLGARLGFLVARAAHRLPGAALHAVVRRSGGTAASTRRTAAPRRGRSSRSSPIPPSRRSPRCATSPTKGTAGDDRPRQPEARDRRRARCRPRRSRGDAAGAAVRDARHRVVDRLPHRLQGLRSRTSRRRDQEPLLAHAAVRGGAVLHRRLDATSPAGDRPPTRCATR